MPLCGTIVRHSSLIANAMLIYMRLSGSHAHKLVLLLAFALTCEDHNLAAWQHKGVDGGVVQHHHLPVKLQQQQQQQGSSSSRAAAAAGQQQQQGSSSSSR
jgi:hypothetical protein